MKLFHLAAATLPFLLFQAPADPPMKMGLWESVGTMPAKEAEGKPFTHIVHSCVTPTNWLKQMGPTAREACPKVHEVWSANTYSFDVQCSGQPKMASVSVTFDSAETVHGRVDIVALPNGQPADIHSTFQEHWIGSDCGDVSPDSPVVVSGAAPSGSH